MAFPVTDAGQPPQTQRMTGLLTGPWDRLMTPTALLQALDLPG